MTQPQIRFDDGAAYERFMGVWSRGAGRVFLDFLSPPTQRRWLDIGCGNGAFTELVMENCDPAEMHGIDPSEGQLAFARERMVGGEASFQQGDAMALPFEDGAFDIAVMALVIQFVPDPACAVGEMARVVRSGGTVAAYVWSQDRAGSPSKVFSEVFRACGISPPTPPGRAATDKDALHDLWADGGLETIETHAITVQRSFESFEDLWTSSTGSGTLKPAVASMDPDSITRAQAMLRERLPADADGQITNSAHANAIKGRVP